MFWSIHTTLLCHEAEFCAILPCVDPLLPHHSCWKDHSSPIAFPQNFPKNRLIIQFRLYFKTENCILPFYMLMVESDLTVVALEQTWSWGASLPLFHSFQMHFFHDPLHLYVKFSTSLCISGKKKLRFLMGIEFHKSFS